jgi:acyl carrier protein
MEDNMESNTNQKLAIALIAEILNVDISKVNPGSAFIDFEGWDSMAHLQIIGEFEDQFQVEIPIEKIKDIARVKDLLEYLE